MNTFPRLINIGLPTVLGMGVAWLSLRVLKNEKRLATRELELKLQLSSKSIKNVKFINDSSSEQ